jgi:putative lipoic acid-binding regulatory protein
MQDLSGRKPEIDYPCRWQFRLIGEERAAMVEAITTLAGIPADEITEANVSSGGRYLSLKIELVVHDDDERLAYYRLLAAHPAIRMVL